jgi:metallo-beta-lactamase family protein
MAPDLGSLTFLGGAGTVTGSKALLDTAQGRVLVDCGLFQGPKELRERNWTDLPVPGEEVDAVLLTHAHLDHCGYLPRLVRQGFRGPILCTDGTRRLAKIVLADSGRLQEEQADHANRHGYSRHEPALPLYTEEDARACSDLFRVVELERQVEVLPGLTATWQRAGHILGAAWIMVRVEDRAEGAGCTAVFSGDLGRDSHPLLRPPAPIGSADLVVTESTYGDRTHPPDDADDAMTDAVDAVVRSRGALVIPAFSVDRTEMVLWHLDRLVGSGRVPRLPVLLDSPMALRALEVYEQETDAGSAEIRPSLRGKPLFPSLDLIEVRTVEESKAVNDRHGPFVVVSASGMVTGGRVLHHLANRIDRPDTIVMLVGYQARGTRGASLEAGASSVRMLGQDFPVRAQVVSVPLSSHADRDELLAWLRTATTPPARVLVNHGEPESTRALVRLLSEELGSRVEPARAGDTVTLRPGGG